MRDTLDMAREAGLVYLSNGLWWMDAGEAGYELKAFEALVREDEREETNRRANASWSLMCEKMVAAEREACAKICEKEQEEWGWDSDVMDAATAIRARGTASIKGNT
jgi:predicted ATP-grasp superfamily ATP-dependent carboligase